MKSSFNIQHHWNKILKGSSDGQWSQVSILEYIKLWICTEIAQCTEVKFDRGQVWLKSSLTAVKFDRSQVWPKSSLTAVKFDRGQVWSRSSCRASHVNPPCTRGDDLYVNVSESMMSIMGSTTDVWLIVTRSTSGGSQPWFTSIWLSRNTST